MIQLDGSFGEGGGALVRTALALSVLTGTSFQVTNIRAGREQSGLKAQHVEAIKALQKMCDAITNGVHLGSPELFFQPKEMKGGTYEIDIGTAGSITLLLQALLLPCLFAPRSVTLRITGGTCGRWQASVDYFQQLLIPHLQRFADKIEVRILKRGYYPRGGGLVEVKITPRFLRKKFPDQISFQQELQQKCSRMMLAEQGKLEQIRGVVNVSAELQEKRVGERIQKSALDSLQDLRVPVNIRVEYAPSWSIGGELLLWAVFSTEGQVDFDNPIFLGSDALVDPGKRSEEIGKEAAAKLVKEIKSRAAVDEHLADQLIPFMALLPGSTIRVGSVSQHTLTNIFIVEQFLPVSFQVKEQTIMVFPR